MPETFEKEMFVNLECHPFDDVNKCCNCGHERSDLSWPVVDSFDEPLIAEQVMDRTLFMYTCEKCGTPNLVAYNCIYHDALFNKVIMLCAYPEDMDLCVEIVDEVCERTSSDGRVVETVDALCEKARIFSCELDDRAVELVKCSWLKKAGEDIEDLAFAEVFFLDELDNGDLHFAVFAPEGDMGLFVRRSIYEAFALEVQMMEIEAPASHMVDHKWASHVLASSGSWD